jgi:tubulin--tyrosine ligase
VDGRASLEPVLQSQVPELLQQLAPDWSDHLIGDDRPDRTKGGSVWIAKPSLTNGGAGVELVPTAGALLTALRANPELREWVIQRYVERPLLVDRRKFHLRVYVLCVGRLHVYVCKDVLALFSLRVYDGADFSERDAHITNTCVQNPESPEEEKRSVQMWDEVVEAIRKEKGDGSGAAAEGVFAEICRTVGDIFSAVSPEQMTFMALPNCFELFGFDFLLDEDYHPWFLEANAEPDFKQVCGALLPS